MAYSSNRDLDTLRKKFRRVLLNGPPNTGKTTSFRTWPGPVRGVVYLGEKGSSSLSMTTTDGQQIEGFVPDDMDVLKPRDWNAEWNDLKKQTADILAGKHGPLRTFFGDGLHKCYQLALASVCGGDNFTGFKNTGEKEIGRLYGRGHSVFWEHVSMIVASSVENVVFSCWQSPDKDNPLDQSEAGKKNMHNMPDLPGQAAQKAMGEFAIVLSTGMEGVGVDARYYWQVTRGGFNWGAGVKLPLEVISKLQLKREVPQDWSKLDAQISKALDEVYTMANNPASVNVDRPIVGIVTGPQIGAGGFDYQNDQH